MNPPEHAWYEREGELAVVGCEHSDTTWHLRCEGSRWNGVVGNCTGSGKRFPKCAVYYNILMIPCILFKSSIQILRKHAVGTSKRLEHNIPQNWVKMKTFTSHAFIFTSLLEHQL